MTYSQNPPTVEEMKDILFVLRTLEKAADPKVLNKVMCRAIADAKYCLQDAIERAAT